MIWNYLKTAVRNILRYKIYSTINIVGLAIGLACCILILLFVQRQFRVNRSFDKADRIYRVIQETRSEDKAPIFNSSTPGGIGPALKAEFPDIKETVRILGWGPLVEGNGKTFHQNLYLADKNFFDVFTASFLEGNPKTALATPSSVVLSESTARRYFGDADPMGQTITVHNRKFPGDYTVTGVIKDLDNSTFEFNLLISDPNRSQETQTLWEEFPSASNWLTVENYVLLPKGDDPKILEQKLPAFTARHLGSELAAKTTYHLQPLTRMYLYSHQDYGFGYNGIEPVYDLSAIAAFLLLLACINFTNLATARSAGRAKEVGLRKVVGAQRGQLIRQFLSEALLMAGAALLIALCLSELLLPTFNNLIGSDLTFTANTLGELLPGFIGVAILTGLMAGSYPAFFLSTYQPIETLKGIQKTGTKGAWLRKGLVVFQFAVSIFLIIGTLVMHNQIRYMLNQDLGFDPTHIVMLPLFDQNQELVENPTDRLSNEYEMIKTAFLQDPDILKATAFRFAPVMNGGGFLRRLRLEGAQGREMQLPVNEVDETFFDTFNIQFAAGRTFSPGVGKNYTSEFIINETAAKRFGWTDPIGKQIEWVGSGTGTVVGVVKDFHFDSMQQKIRPDIFVKRTTLFTWVGLKVRGGDLTKTLKFMETTWNKFAPTQPFEYRLLNEDINQFAYQGAQRLMTVSGVASILAILIACLGLLGLAAFSAHQRIKEIGVRKVLGASVANIILLLSKNFLTLVGLANLVAWPVAYVAMSFWLQQYPYRTTLGVSSFLLSGLLAVVIALATVSWQALKVARSNPIDALRNE